MKQAHGRSANKHRARWLSTAFGGMLLAVVAPMSAHAGNAVCYVRANAPAGGNGLSWATAFNNLQAAVDLVNPPPGGGATTFGQIWVAEGTYKPTMMWDGSPREMSWFLVNNCQFLGGFVGNETSASQRDWVAHPTILSGDVGVPGVHTDNTRRILRIFSQNTPANTVLDGFIVTLGRADGNMQRGGGLHGDDSGGGATIRNCVFVDNRADLQGAAIYTTGTTVVENCQFANDNINLPGGSGAARIGGGSFINCTFTNNNRGGAHGATTLRNCWFENTAGLSSPASAQQAFDCTFINNTATDAACGLGASGASPFVSRCVFINNHGASGALGINASTSGVVINCTFLGNSASVFEGGAIRNTGSGQLRVLNSRFSGNSAPIGGAIWMGGFAGPMTVANCTFSYNTATSSAGGVWIYNSGTIANSIFWGNGVNGNTSESSQIALHSNATFTINRSCVQGWTGTLGGVGNTGSNPTFINALGPDSTVGTADDDLRLMPTSPCIDSGANASAPNDYVDYDNDGNIIEFVPIDVLGNARFFDAPATPDTGTGTPPIIDMGAIEFDGTGVPQPPGTFVGSSGGSWFVASNWAGNAIPDSNTDVFIPTLVVIGQSGALAHAITIQAGGTLFLNNGGLSASATTTVQSGGTLSLDGAATAAALTGLTVESGGTLMLDDPASMLTSTAIAMQTGSNITWNSGIIGINGGSWTNSAALSVGCTGSAEMRLLNGTVVAPQVNLCAQGLLSGNGIVNGSVSNGGATAPGASPGLITINGPYTQTSAGTLAIDVLNYALSGYDSLIVNGAANIAGTLNVTALPGFLPTLAGDQRFIVANSQNGAFATTNLPSLPGAFALTVQYQILMPDQNHQAVRLLTSLSSSGARLYVNGSASAGGDGQTWAQASNNLLGALNQAALMPTTIHEVWIAAGVYKPDDGTGERSTTLLVGPGLAIYGGFAGGETDLSQRDFIKNETILNGDLAGNDGPIGTFTNNAENVYHVVTTICSNCPNPPRVDGFTITGGNSNLQNSLTHQVGGGMRAEADGQVIANCRIVGNFATQRGGGASVGVSSVIQDCAFVSNKSMIESAALHVGGGAPQIIGCTFDGTTAEPLTTASAVTVPSVANAGFVDCTFTDNSGGSVVKVMGNTFFTTTLENCVFVSNPAQNPIDAQNDSTVVLTDCTLTGNGGRAINNIGAKLISLTGCTISNNAGGGIRSAGNGSIVNLTAVDCAFIGNTAGLSPNQGAALRITSGAATLTDCTFSDNQASDLGGAIYNGSVLTLDNCTFSGNSAPNGSAIYNYLVGDLRGSASFLGDDELYNAGSLSPGAAGQHGQFTVDGTFRQVNIVPFTSFTGIFPGTLRLSLGGTTPVTQHDVIDATNGTVVLQGGALEVNLTDGFVPQIDQEFTVIPAPTTAGSFDVATMPGLPSGLFMDVSYGPGGVVLSVEELLTLLSLEQGAGTPLDGVPIAGEAVHMDSDLFMDVVLLFPGRTAGANGHATVLHNLGVDPSGQWLGFDAQALNATVGIDPRSMTIGLLNNDGYADVAVGNYGGSVTVLFNAADNTGALNFASTITTASSVVSITSAARPEEFTCDLAVASASGSMVRMYMNNGLGTFTPGASFTHARPPIFVALRDLDLDEDADLITVRRQAGDLTNPATIEVREFDAQQGTFGAGMDLQAGLGTTACEVADMNNDNLPDIIAIDTAGGGLSLLLNGANQVIDYAQPIRMPIGIQPRSLVVRDFDIDGDIDLAFLVNAPTTGEPRVRVLRNDFNNYNLVFATASDTAVNGEAQLIFAGDVTLSNRPDVLVVSADAPPLAGGGATLEALIDFQPADTCPADITNDNGVDFSDLLEVINNWGPCATSICPADIEPPGGDDVVDISDLLAVINSWGACP